MEGGEADSLDLSHLTDEEQASILEVLIRDSELRRLDEGRVRTLQQKETDPIRLRSLSGTWFSEERSKHHRDWKQGCDLVRASIRRRRTKAKDVPLAGLFNGGAEQMPSPSPRSSPLPGVEGRLEDTKAKREEKRGFQEHIAPMPTPRTKSPTTQHQQNSADCSSAAAHTSECNGLQEETEEDSDGRGGDTDSVSSGETELDRAHLKTASSVSLQSSYKLSGSMMSLFSSGEFGVVEVKGRVQFSLVYETEKEELHVRVYRCEGLAAARKNRSDPYVKTYLLPDKSAHSKKKTSVKRRTLNPVYDQTLRYKMRQGEIQGRTLNLSVWHAKPLGKNVFLGEVEVGLGLWDWTATHPVWQDLQPRVQLTPDSISSRGTILLSVKFVPEGSEGSGLPLTGELHIWLREAQGLLSNKGGAVDSFVRSYILPDTSRQSGQKTRVVKRSISPTYNHTMVYDGFQTADLNEACAEMTVWQRDGLKTQPLGGIRLSPGIGQSYGEAVPWMDSTEEEVAVWTSMIQNPNNWIDTTLPIRTNLRHRT
ncbi:synaptotagmin-like protein 1 [Lampris incognitus]|uniref:synaptotagmin-like protein 1 n=1 Tax=Lampris incognitus TaxID=2546036 RepID=UPI0024B4F0EA|nr:synaptotagmin-like protein 1 [Lampris incognitus]